jgi:hypothetical protein
MFSCKKKESIDDVIYNQPNEITEKINDTQYRVNHKQNNSIDIMLSNSGLNEKQKEIYRNLIRLRYNMYQDEDEYDYSTFEEKKEQAKALIITFLKTDINWDEDIAKRIPFINSFCISEDGYIKIFNLMFETRGTGEYFYHLVQYKIKSSTVMTESDILYDVEYSIYTLKNNLYLLFGTARSGGETYRYRLHTVQIVNNELSGYLAFKGNHTLLFDSSPREDRSELYDFNFNFDDRENIFMEFEYHNGNRIKLIFDGVEFLGDY